MTRRGLMKVLLLQGVMGFLASVSSTKERSKEPSITFVQDCEQPVRRFRCSNGHIWEEKDHTVSCNGNVQLFTPPGAHVRIGNNPTDFCYLCMAEFWEKTLGIVEEVEP